MKVLTVVNKTQQYAMRKDIAKIFGYKDPGRLLKGFRDYADANPGAFKPHTPYVSNTGMEPLYDILCFAYYFENRDLLDAGSKSISFKAELPRLREAYRE